MKQKLDLETWNRKQHFDFFKTFDEPYYGVTATIDCTIAYAKAKELGISFYIYYLHKTLTVVNAIENLKYRIEDGEVFIYDRIDASATIFSNDLTFGFSHINYDPDLDVFSEIAKAGDF